MGPWFAGLIRTALSPLCWASTTWPQPDPSAVTPWWTFLRYDPCDLQQPGTSPPHRRSLLRTPPPSLFCCFFSAAACFARVSLWLLRFPTAFWVKVLTGSAFVNWLQSSSFGSQEAVINSARGKRRFIRDLDHRCPSWLVACIQFIWPSAYRYCQCIASIYICLNNSATACEDGWFFSVSLFGTDTEIVQYSRKFWYLALVAKQQSFSSLRMYELEILDNQWEGIWIQFKLWVRQTLHKSSERAYENLGVTHCSNHKKVTLYTK